MSEYERYPLTLTHPAYTPAVVSKGEVGTHGRPERFPPVTALDELQEGYYKAQGYEEAGHVDPAAWAQQHASPPPALYDVQEYPKWIDGRLVNSIDDDPTVDPEAREAAKVAALMPQADPEKDELRAQLAAMQEQIQGLLQAQKGLKRPPGRPRKEP